MDRDAEIEECSAPAPEPTDYGAALLSDARHLEVGAYRVDMTEPEREMTAKHATLTDWFRCWTPAMQERIGQSIFAGMAGHRWGWLIQVIGYDKFREVARLPEGDRLNYIQRARIYAIVAMNETQLFGAMAGGISLLVENTKIMEMCQGDVLEFAGTAPIEPGKPFSAALYASAMYVDARVCIGRHATFTEDEVEAIIQCETVEAWHAFWETHVEWTPASAREGHRWGWLIYLAGYDELRMYVLVELAKYSNAVARSESRMFRQIDGIADDALKFGVHIFDVCSVFATVASAKYLPVRVSLRTNTHA
jgi:hypothetical protein